MSKRPTVRPALLALGCALALAATASPASAAVSWQLTSISNTSVDPHGHMSLSTVVPGAASPAADEVQRLALDAGGGQFRLSLGPDVTADLPFDATAAEVQAGLEALPSIGSGNVAVSPASPFGTAGPFLVTFQGALGNQDVASLQGQDGTQPLAGRLTYYLTAKNEGDDDTDGNEVRLNVSLPAGLRGLRAAIPGEILACPTIHGATGSFTCAGTPAIARKAFFSLAITVAVDPAASGALTTGFELEGGGALAAAHSVDPVNVTAAAPAFGFDAFDFALTRGALSDTRAAAHPERLTTAIDYVTHADQSELVGDAWPLEDVRDVEVDTPPGFVGATSGLDRCTIAEIANGDFAPMPLCSPDSQVGVASVRTRGLASSLVPLFNMVPPPGAPARFAFNANGSIIVLDAHVRSSSDYGLTVTSSAIPQLLALAGNTIEFWGLPSAASHDPDRSCPGSEPPSAGGPFCDADTSGAFYRTSTSCAAPGHTAIAARIDSWADPEGVVSDSVPLHEAPGYPYPRSDWGAPVGIEGCEQVPFQPTLKASLTTDRADAPTGLTVDLGLPADCWQPKATDAEAEDSICQSDMRRSEVTLPAGLTLNPSSANGRAACSPGQFGLLTPVGSSPVHFDEAPVSCPDASKIGTVQVETPLLGKHDKEGKPVLDAAGTPVPEPLTGSLYLAEQGNNPPGSLVSIYLVAEGQGVVLKQAAEVSLDPQTGQLLTTFDETPQQPFSKIHFELFGGSRASLRTPATCGTYTATASLTPWSGTGAVTRNSSFQITQGCGGGFDPKLSAGTENPLAARTSPFNLRITRNDAEQELGGLSLTMPPGLSGYLKGIPYCPDATLAGISDALGTGRAQEASPSCPKASELGRVTVGAGAGPNPFYTTSGRAYLAGPYKGAPISLAVVTPAVAGPFDLGTVVVRNALRIDPESAQITAVSDPLPTIVHGIPLDLRDVRVSLDRDHFTLNPSNCDPLRVGSQLTSTAGKGASPSVHFQVSGCDRLRFKPRLSLKLKGGTRRSDHPALTAVLRPRPGDANLARVRVALPHSEFLAQSHIRTICTRVQFAADNCPRGSIYGKVTARTPIVDYPLTGNVYLRSSSHPLPDMVLALRGPASQPIEIDAVGRIDSKDGGIRATFATVPDQPLSKVVLRMPAGKKSLLENSTNICRHRQSARVQMNGQNARRSDSKVRLRVKCPKQRKGKHHGPKRGHR